MKKVTQEWHEEAEVERGQDAVDVLLKARRKCEAARDQKCTSHACIKALKPKSPKQNINEVSYDVCCLNISFLE
jgi:hypothetical protein